MQLVTAMQYARSGVMSLQVSFLLKILYFLSFLSRGLNFCPCEVFMFGRVASRSAISGVLLCGIFCLRTAAPQTPAPRAETQLKPEKAVWGEYANTSFGLSREDFAQMGFSKLSYTEFALVLQWAFRDQLRGESQGRSEAYSCGPKTVDETSASKVKVLVENHDSNPSGLMSAIRQRLRAIPDVKIVYDSNDADLTADIMAHQPTIDGGYVGYDASVLTAIPCRSKVTAAEQTFNMVANHFQVSGGNVDTVAEVIVTRIDSRDIETIRREHASLLKYFRDQK